MKKFLKTLPIIIIGFISFVTVTLIDFILILTVFLNKVIRSIFVWLMCKLDPDDDPVLYEVSKENVNTTVNYAYQYYIDLLYPAEEDLEEDSESDEL